mgnify:CR=1 FL=1
MKDKLNSTKKVKIFEEEPKQNETIETENTIISNDD